MCALCTIWEPWVAWHNPAGKVMKNQGNIDRKHNHNVPNVDFCEQESSCEHAVGSAQGKWTLFFLFFLIFLFPDLDLLPKTISIHVPWVPPLMNYCQILSLCSGFTHYNIRSTIDINKYVNKITSNRNNRILKYFPPWSSSLGISFCLVCRAGALSLWNWSKMLLHSSGALILELWLEKKIQIAKKLAC